MKSLLFQNLNHITPGSMPYSDESHEHYCEIYKHHLKSEKKLGPLVVLDVFSGIGSIAVVLKQLKISVKTIISVENDRVAAHVKNYNHNSKYNDELADDGIQYIDEYSSFEKLETSLDDMCKKYGPIDLVVGGPPCSDNSEDSISTIVTQDESTNYFLKFGKMITKLQEHNKNIFFLSENLVYRKDSTEQVVNAYDLMPPVQIKPKYITSNTRNRFFWVNLPVESINLDMSVFKSSPLLLDGGYKLPATVIDSDAVRQEDVVESSREWQDDPRNWKAKLSVSCANSANMIQAEYQVTNFSVGDREKILGLQIGYVSKAIKTLFSALKKDAFDCEGENGKHWYDTLDKKYHHFYECDFKMKPDVDNFYAIMIKDENSERYFDSEEYSKHLLDKSWSIEIVKKLLKPLKKICKKKKYNYC